MTPINAPDALLGGGESRAAQLEAAITAQVTGSAEAELTDEDATQPMHNSQSHPYPIDTRVEVWWTEEKQWFPGTVISACSKSIKLKGRWMDTPHVQIEYDDGWTYTHSLHNNTIRKLKLEGSVLVLQDVTLDMETGEAMETQSLFVVNGDGKLLKASSTDPKHAQHWHTPHDPSQSRSMSARRREPHGERPRS